MSRTINSMLSAFQSKVLAPGEQNLTHFADRMGDAIDRNLPGGVGRRESKRVDVSEIKKRWATFNTNINKFFAENCKDPMKDHDDELALFGGVDEDDVFGGGLSGTSGRSAAELAKERAYLDEHIKPHLQRIIGGIEVEERGKKKMHSAMGECVEYLLQENMVQVLCGLARSDRPKGLLNLSLKFIMYLMRNVKSTEILNYGPNHAALHGLLQFIFASMENEMMVLQAEDKQVLIDFLYHLTLRITYSCPELADLLLADQTTTSRKEQRHNYVPLQLALLLLIREDHTDTEQCRTGLRKVLVLQLKQATINNRIKEYVLAESDMPILLVAKLAHFFGLLPD